MPQLMTPEQISDWERKQKKGKFSYILEQTMIFTPVFLLARLIAFYFFEERILGLGTALEMLIVSFFTSLGCCAFSWYQQQNIYKKSLAQKSENII